MPAVRVAVAERSAAESVASVTVADIPELLADDFVSVGLKVR